MILINNHTWRYELENLGIARHSKPAFRWPKSSMEKGASHGPGIANKQLHVVMIVIICSRISRPRVSMCTYILPQSTQLTCRCFHTHCPFSNTREKAPVRLSPRNLWLLCAVLKLNIDKRRRTNPLGTRNRCPQFDPLRTIRSSPIPPPLFQYLENAV